MVAQELTRAMKDEAGAYADMLYPDEVAKCIGYRVQDCLYAGEHAIARSIVRAVIQHGKSEGLTMTAERNARGHLTARRPIPTSMNALGQLAIIRDILDRAVELRERGGEYFNVDYDLIDHIRTVLG